MRLRSLRRRCSRLHVSAWLTPRYLGRLHNTFYLLSIILSLMVHRDYRLNKPLLKEITTFTFLKPQMCKCVVSPSCFVAHHTSVSQ